MIVLSKKPSLIPPIKIACMDTTNVVNILRPNLIQNHEKRVSMKKKFDL
jgi:hypothetical protein